MSALAEPPSGDCNATGARTARPATSPPSALEHPKASRGVVSRLHGIQLVGGNGLHWRLRVCEHRRWFAAWAQAQGRGAGGGEPLRPAEGTSQHETSMHFKPHPVGQFGCALCATRSRWADRARPAENGSDSAYRWSPNLRSATQRVRCCLCVQPSPQELRSQGESVAALKEAAASKDEKDTDVMASFRDELK